MNKSTKSEHSLSPEQFVRLQGSWVQLLATFSVNPAAAYPVFDRLVARHSEPHRHYHTLEHLAEMMRVAGRLADFAADLPTIQLAIWFHDSVYDPRAKDNEARSSDLMRESLAPLGIPESLLDRVTKLILATAHADLPDVDADTSVLLDADLAILSAEEKRYARYADDIRREYDWVEDSAYRQGREVVLKSFLARPRIYRTERMHAVAEEAARKNLAWEIERLTPRAE